LKPDAEAGVGVVFRVRDGNERPGIHNRKGGPVKRRISVIGNELRHHGHGVENALIHHVLPFTVQVGQKLFFRVERRTDFQFHTPNQSVFVGQPVDFKDNFFENELLRRGILGEQAAGGHNKGENDDQNLTHEPTLSGESKKQKPLDAPHPPRYSVGAMKEIDAVTFSEGSSRIFLASKDDVLPPEAKLSVFDGNTALLFPDRNPECSVALPPGEAAKNWASVERILNRALTLSMGRDELMVGIGGGVLTDVTAFAASLYMRGCRLILVPTTLLSMVDAATGGKTGIDFGGVKNLVGTFYPADEVRICPALLESLPEREYLSGMAEIIKHAMLAPGEGSDSLWNMVENEREAILARDEDVLLRLIPAAVKVKVDIVSEDLRETGRRAFLNLGHTFGHALETATNFSRWSHGEAVAWGILCALDLGERLGLTDKAWAGQCRRLIADYGFDLITPQVSPGEIKSAMTDDKKKRNGRLRFIMMEGPGRPVIQEVPEADLDAVLGIE
jgi:3-dehydroquinate synthase